MIKKNTIITFNMEEIHIYIPILLSYNNKID